MPLRCQDPPRACGVQSPPDARDDQPGRRRASGGGRRARDRALVERVHTQLQIGQETGITTTPVHTEGRVG